MVIVLIGPMGCGKTTIGRLLAHSCDWTFEDGDDFHPAANKAKMKAGEPLDDFDREPWLLALNSHITKYLSSNKNMVMACSALKKKYRDLLGIDQKMIYSVYLKGTQELLKERISARNHEFMNDSLLISQFAALEEPEDGLIVNVQGTPQEIVEEIVKKLIKR